MSMMPGLYLYPPFNFNEVFTTWLRAWEKALTSSQATWDFRMWFPAAYRLDWYDPKTWQARLFDPSIWLPMGFSPEDRPPVNPILGEK